MKRVLALVVALLLPASALAQTEPDSPPPPSPPQPMTRPRLLLSTGVDYRRIYDIGMTLGSFALGLGIEQGGNRRAGFFGLEIQAGSTEYGLAVVDYRLGGGLEWRFGRFRPGFGADIGWLTIARATTSDYAKTLWIGVYAQALLDLVDLGDGEALYLGAKLGVDLLGAPPSPLVWGPSALVGVRF